jgi:CRP-like cAMP-binding protein
MAAQRQPIIRAESVATEAIARTWPMASPVTVEQLARAVTFLQKPAGATLLAQGERPSRVALILSGTFVGTWNAPDGRVVDGAIVDVDPSGPAQFAGVTTLNGAPIISGLDAVTAVTMLTWPSEEFGAITASDLAVTRELLDRSIYAIRVLDHLMQLRSFTTASSRLAGVLLRYETLCFGQTPRMARGQLSAIAGVTPQMVSRIFRRWEAASIVRRLGASGLELRDRDALQAEASQLAQFPPPDPPGRPAPRTPGR